MDIIITNFEKTLPLFQEALASCQFLAFDCEFSGLGVSTSTIKEEDQVGDFQIVQLGITTYHRNEKTFAYKAKTFNFYVFPAAINRFKQNKLFISQPSAIKFLSEQSFDFNKLFYYGIPYLSKRDEELLRDFRQEEATSTRENIEVDERGKAFLEQAM
ncbi:hypothetical protein DSO57_1008206 [Entomophthora muscae]|uniref:Uncharacterized protein n=1 Tax=Entomophthora muscae TaxID=34485 RepID=A0ACC2SWA5_9FUNG|nr:hypothetical protein DSO57_1008206 [Entomophthora muscae]